MKQELLKENQKKYEAELDLGLNRYKHIKSILEELDSVAWNEYELFAAEASRKYLPREKY